MSGHRIAIHLTAAPDEETEQRFKTSAFELHKMFKYGGVDTILRSFQTIPTSVIAHVENRHDVQNIIWVRVVESEHLKSCKVMTRLVMQRALLGGAYEIIVDPGPREISSST